jgi:hypothetical protein
MPECVQASLWRVECEAAAQLFDILRTSRRVYEIHRLDAGFRSIMIAYSIA